MKTFTEQILESDRRFNVMTSKDMEDYASKLSKDLPDDVKKVIGLLVKYNITDESVLNRIMHGGPVDLKVVSKDVGTSQSNIESLRKDIDKLGEMNVNMLPLLVAAEDRKSLMSGDKNIEDIVLDLASEKGRANVVKRYSKMAVAIAAKYRGNCGLDWNSLVSAANMGLVKAMNDYKRNIHTDAEDDKMKKLSFKQYAGYRIKQQILNDIADYSRVVKVTRHGVDTAKEEGKSFTTVHIDWNKDKDDNGSIADAIVGLTTDPVVGKTKDSGQMDKIFDMLDKKFSDKTLTIFYSYFGLHGYKKMTQLALAKQYGITVAAANQNVKKVITWLQEDKRTRALLQELLDVYSESLISGNYKNLEETLVGDDMFKMLIEAWEYSSAEYTINRIGDCLDCLSDEDAIVLEKCILTGDREFIDNIYDDHKESINLFCSMMYPVDSWKKTDISAMEQLMSINQHLKELEII